MRLSKRRAGISEFIATLIMIAITLVAGTAAFGWIISQAGTSEQSYGNSVAVGVNFLNERFVVISQSFNDFGGPPPPSCPLSIYPGVNQCRLAHYWLYNTGTVDFTLSTIEVKSLTTPPDGHAIDIIYNSKWFSAFNAGVNITAGCTNVDPPNGFIAVNSGFMQNGAPPVILKQGFVSSPYDIAMPTCGGGGWGQMYLFDGTTYTMILTGLYGNIVTQSITPNG